MVEMLRERDEVGRSTPGVVSKPATAVFVVVALAAFMAFLDTTIVNIALPAISLDFPQDSRSLLSWILNSYNIVFAALLVPAGRLADRYGHGRVFIGGLAIFTCASGLCAVAPSVEMLIVFRALQAAGAATLVPTGIALLLPAYPSGRKIAAIAMLGAVSGAAMATGPSIGGAIVQWSSWRAVFFINLPLGVVTIATAWVVVRRLGRRVRGQIPDVVGIILTMLAVGLLALAITQGNDWGWTDDRVLAAFAGAAAALPVIIRRATHHAVPAVDPSLFRVSSVNVANVATLLFGVGLGAKLLCDVLFMTTVWHFSVIKTGLAVSPSPIVTAIAARSAGGFAERYGTRAAAVPGGLLYAVGCLWFVLFIGARPAYVAEFLPGTVFTGIGIALILPTLTSAAVMNLGEDRLGSAAALNSMARQLGVVVGVAAFVAVVGTPSPVEAVSSFHDGWLLAALMTGASGLVAIGIGARMAARPVFAMATEDGTQAETVG